MQRNIVRNFNPFRYRGYYYDVETSLYYLQSRYYDPAMGRFLNADGYVSTGTGLLGYNMYAYCNNNPVMGYDPNGNIPWIPVTPANLYTTQKIAAKVAVIYVKLAEDRRNYDENNDDPSIALECNYYSCYKGKLVIRSPFSRPGSFGAIFIPYDMRTYDEKGYDNSHYIMHEYGHTVQLNEMGAMKYLFCVGIPSVFEWGSDSYYGNSYYDRPWELMADLYGGVTRSHDPRYITEAHYYNRLCNEVGILVWLRIH